MGLSIHEEQRDASLFIEEKPKGLFALRAALLAAFPSLIYQPFALGLDGSHYIKVDWDVIAPQLSFVKWKATEGPTYQDETFPDACQAAYDHNLPFGAYHFFRIDQYLGLPFPEDDATIDKYWPSPSQDTQLQNLIHALENKAVNSLAIDIEATKELASGNPINSAWASKVAKIFTGRAYDWWYKSHPGKPFQVYSSNGYINTWAPDMANWVGAYDSWTAQWAVYPASATSITWEQAHGAYLPSDASKPKPLGNGTVKLWQYTGDRLILPGVYTNDSRHLPRTVDLNLFMGSNAAMMDYFKYKPHGSGSTPPDDQPPAGNLADWQKAIETRLTALESKSHDKAHTHPVTVGSPQ